MRRLPLEGRVVIHDCGCWRIRSYPSESVVLRAFRCAAHTGEVLDFLEKKLYLDKVDSVSAPDEDEEQLWLT